MKQADHRRAYVLLAALLAVDVAVFLLQKGASDNGDSEGIALLKEIAASPLLWLALGLAPVQLWIWTRVLRRSDIGWAYALTSLAYPVTMLAACMIFGERYGWHVWLGAILITAGAAVLGPQHSSHDPAANPTEKPCAETPRD